MSRILFILGPSLFALLQILPFGLTSVQQSMAAIMAWVIVWWLHPTIPLAITGLIGVCLSVLLGAVKFQAALAGFANPIIFLFMGGFFFAEALRYQATDLWIAERCLSMKIIKGSALRVLICLTILTAIFSSILSNSATTAMMMPLALSLFTHLKIRDDHPSFKLLLLIAYAASIGGIGTPLGTPPNVLGISLLNSMAGIQITFMDWVFRMFPLMLGILIAVFAIFWKELKMLPKGIGVYARPAALTISQRRVLYLLGATICLWFLPGMTQLILGSDHQLSKFLIERMPEGLVAILMSSFLFIIPGKNNETLLPWRESHKIDWGTLLLFGSGISLGQTVFDSGLAAVLGNAMPFQQLPYALALLLMLLVTLILTEFMSNTASANLLVPLVIVTPPFSQAPMIPVICVTLVCSLGFMLPVGTPPNAIAYGTGKIKIRWMFDKGFKLNIICLLIIWVMGLLQQ